MNIKQLIASIVIVLGTWMSAGAMAQPTPYDFTFSSGVYDGQSYSISYVGPTSYGADPSIFNVSNMAWWGDQALASAIATQVGLHYGYVDTYNTPGFAYTYVGSPGAGSVYLYSYYTGISSLNNVSLFESVTTSFATGACTGGCGGGVAPEMNASLIPQVGLLLGCLFFLLGRKKEAVQPLLTV